MAAKPELDDIIGAAELRTALRRFFRTTEIAARESGLTPRQYLLLLLVKGAPDREEHATIGDLSERLQLAQSTVTELVGRAAAADLVAVTQSAEDGRVTEVRVAPEGERRMLECFNRLGAEREALAELLGEQLVSSGV